MVESRDAGSFGSGLGSHYYLPPLPDAVDMKRHHRSWGALLPSCLVLAVMGLQPQAGQAQDPPAGPFVTQVLGEWQGHGDYQGNSLALSRIWTIELGGQFLRADMRVAMPNGASFSAMMYWKRIAPDVYEIVWLDGIGRLQMLQALRDPESGLVSTTFLDEFAENGPEWRTWEFESLGEDSYAERLYRVHASGQELLTVFSFERVAHPDRQPSKR